MSQESKERWHESPRTGRWFAAIDYDHPLSVWLLEEETTMKGLADTLGVHKSTVTRICSGQHRPRAELAVEIEKATGGDVTAEDLILYGIR